MRYEGAQDAEHMMTDENCSIQFAGGNMYKGGIRADKLHGEGVMVGPGNPIASIY